MAVDGVPLKVILVVDKVIDNPLIHRLEDAAVLAAPGELKLEAGDKGQLCPVLRLHGAVKGHYNPALVLLGADRFRQGACHVPQAAGCDKGTGLAGRIENFHVDTFLS